MKMASCVYGMHLDMNPHHTGFLFTNITELKGRNYKSELLSTQMEIDTARYIEYAPKDFFYMTLHDPTPPPIEGERIVALGHHDPFAQSPHRWAGPVGGSPSRHLYRLGMVRDHARHEGNIGLRVRRPATTRLG